MRLTEERRPYREQNRGTKGAVTTYVQLMIVPSQFTSSREIPKSSEAAKGMNVRNEIRLHREDALNGSLLSFATGPNQSRLRPETMLKITTPRRPVKRAL